MRVEYFSGTDVNLLNQKLEEMGADTTSICMLDGTIPGWEPRPGDIHYDHHRPGGGLVQIDELPEIPHACSLLEQIASSNAFAINKEGQDWSWIIATTQTDADAAVAAAYVQVSKVDLDELLYKGIRKLRAIALDCDYLLIPQSETNELPYAEFAAKAVAGLKESSKGLDKELGLPSDRKTWTGEQKILFSSETFKRSTQWLIDAVKGIRPYPGESGEADSYFEGLQKDLECVRQLNMVRAIQGCAFLDMRSVNKYLDPRVLVMRSQEMEGVTQPVTLTCRSMNIKIGDLLIPAQQYTLGSLPYHPQARDLDLTKVFPVLAEAEAKKRKDLGFPAASTNWGGRAAVGGSGWNDASLMTPEEVLAIALDVITQ